VKKIAAFAAGGAVLTGLLAGGAYYLSIMELFVIAGLIVIALSFVPLFVHMIKTAGSSKPTLFGTSTPGSFSTISHAQEQGKTIKTGKVHYAAGAGLGALIIFLTVVLIQSF
jgi:hypothetical protein